MVMSTGPNLIRNSQYSTQNDHGVSSNAADHNIEGLGVDVEAAAQACAEYNLLGEDEYEMQNVLTPASCARPRAAAKAVADTSLSLREQRQRHAGHVDFIDVRDSLYSTQNTTAKHASQLKPKNEGRQDDVFKHLQKSI